LGRGDAGKPSNLPLYFLKRIVGKKRRRGPLKRRFPQGQESSSIGRGVVSEIDKEGWKMGKRCC